MTRMAKKTTELTIQVETNRREHVDHSEREARDHGHASEIEGRNHLLTQVQEGPIIAGQLIDASGINDGWSNSVPVGSCQACNRRRLCAETVERRIQSRPFVNPK